MDLVIRIVVLLSGVVGLAGCRIDVDDVGSGTWEAYEVRLLGNQVRFELPSEAVIYGAPAVETTEVGEEGFVGVYFIGFGANPRTGLGSQIHAFLQVKEIVGPPISETDVDALKQAVEDRGDYLAERAGRDPVSRLGDFETLDLVGRTWVRLRNPTGTSLSTYFDRNHFLSLVVSSGPRFEPNQRELKQLEELTSKFASKVEIRPIPGE